VGQLIDIELADSRAALRALDSAASIGSTITILTS